MSGSIIGTALKDFGLAALHFLACISVTQRKMKMKLPNNSL
jgi:hypothetical protein